jgi:hypothetical protein
VSVPSSEVGPPYPLPRKRVRFPPWIQRRGRATLACGEGVGIPNADDWTESLALCIVLCGGGDIQIPLYPPDQVNSFMALLARESHQPSEDSLGTSEAS